MKMLIAAIILVAFGQQALAYDQKARQFSSDATLGTHKELSTTLLGPRGKTVYATHTVCIDGYKFVIVRDTVGIAVTQFYRRGSSNNYGAPIPASCTD